MPETRTDRTPYLGLLALMMVAADIQGWSYPYWNTQQIDAALAALAQGPRDGTVLAAPDAAPTASVLSSGGSLPGGQSLEVVQTFVDVFGRETLAGPACALSTGAGMTDPLAAPTLTNPSSAGSGYEGGLLQAWYTWVDSAGGETLASPECDLDLPYLTGGLYTQVTFSLPCTPASVGAAGANVYICQRGGNIVLAKRILSSSATTCTLDANVADCYRSLPVANSTNGNKALQITAGASAPAGVAYTRFYVRPATQDWTAGDRRVKVSGADQWAPASVPYPITYAGLLTDLAPGFPPVVSQVKAFRPIDLTTEVLGRLDTSHIDTTGFLTTSQLTDHTEDTSLHFSGTEKTDLGTLQGEMTAIAALIAGGGGGGVGLSDGDFAREIQTMLVAQKGSIDLRPRVAPTAFLDGFADDAGTDTGAAYDALDTANKRLTCAVAGGGGGSPTTMYSGTSGPSGLGNNWVGQEIASDTGDRTLNGFSMCFAYDGDPDQGVSADTYPVTVYLFEQPDGPGTAPTAGPVFTYSTHDFTKDNTVNGVAHCATWAGLAATLDAGVNYLLAVCCPIGLGGNFNTYPSGDFGAAHAWHNPVANTNVPADDLAALEAHWSSSSWMSDYSCCVAMTITPAASPTTVHWTSAEQTIAAGIKSLLADWFVAQAPTSGATITPEVKIGSADWASLAKATSVVPEGSPTTVQFRLTIENTDADTEIWIDGFGAIWELAS